MKRKGERQGKPQLQEPRNPLPTVCVGLGKTTQQSLMLLPLQGNARGCDTCTQETWKLTRASLVSTAFPTWTRFALLGRQNPRAKALKHLTMPTSNPSSHPQPEVRTPLSSAFPSPQASIQPSPTDLDAHDLDAQATVLVMSLTCSQSLQAAEGTRWAQTHLKKQLGTYASQELLIWEGSGITSSVRKPSKIAPPTILSHYVTWLSQMYLPLQLSW